MTNLDFKVLVTGGSGILGHYVMDALIGAGCEVVNGDIMPMGELRHSGNVGKVSQAEPALALRGKWDVLPAFKRMDVKNYGQVISAMEGCQAVVALAACPTPFNYVEEEIMHTNVMAAWNVCKAAEQLQIEKVVLGSSYNAIGAQATAMARWPQKLIKPPEYFPLDSASASRAEDSYSISKWLDEQVGDAFVRRSPQMSIASLRFTGVWDDSYFKQLNKSAIVDPWERCQGFWAYVNIRDAAEACLAAVKAPNWHKHHRLFINARDTMLGIPTADALRAVYPDVEVRRSLGTYDSVFDISETKSAIGWEPKLSWRDAQYRNN